MYMSSCGSCSLATKSTAFVDVGPTACSQARPSAALRNIAAHCPKRPRCEEDVESEAAKENRGAPSQGGGAVFMQCNRRFLRIPHTGQAFHTEEWKNKQVTLYLPLTEDILVNVQPVEQISFASGSFFIADSSGTYQGSQEGQVVHLWRYDDQLKKLFIFRSFLFTDSQLYNYIRRQLEEI